MGEKEFLEHMGKRIRAIRLKRGMTLRDIEKLNVTDFGHLCRIESGKIGCTILLLKKLADAMNVKVRDFL
jgi:transcriptional regulator with XRE-family HTH domain